MKSSTRDKVEGTLHEVKGKVKETAGKLSDNKKLKAEGDGRKDRRQSAKKGRSGQEEAGEVACPANRAVVRWLRPPLEDYLRMTETVRPATGEERADCSQRLDSLVVDLSSGGAVHETERRP